MKERNEMKTKLVLMAVIVNSLGMNAHAQVQKQSNQDQNQIKKDSKMLPWEAEAPTAMTRLNKNHYLISAWHPCAFKGLSRIQTSTQVLGCEVQGEKVIATLQFYYRSKKNQAQCCGGDNEYAFEKRLNFDRKCNGLEPTHISFVDKEMQEIDLQEVKAMKHPYIIRNYSILKGVAGINRVCTQVMEKQKIDLPNGDRILKNPTEKMGACYLIAEPKGLAKNHMYEVFGFGYASGDQVCQAHGYRYSKNVKMGCIEEKSYGEIAYIYPFSIINSILFSEGKKKCTNNVITEVTCTNVEPIE